MSKNKTLFGENVATVECHYCGKRMSITKAFAIRRQHDKADSTKIPACEECFPSRA